MRSLFKTNLRVGLLSDETVEEDARRREEEASAREQNEREARETAEVTETAEVAEGADDAVVQEEVEIEEPAADTLEAELIEIQDAEVEGAAQEEEVDHALEVHEALESLILDMSVSMESGGMNRDAAQFATRHADYLLQSVGMPATRRVMPGLESFGGVASRQNATRLSMESLGEQVKKLWQRILEQINRAYEWVRSYLLKMFAAGEKVKARAESVKAAAESLGDKKAANDEIERDSLVKNVSVGGKPALDGLTKVETIAKGINGAWPTITEKGGKAIAEFMAECASNKAPADLSYSILSSFAGVKGMKEGKSDKDGFQLLVSEELPGGVHLEILASETTDAVAQSQQTASLVHGGGEASGKLKVLSKDEIIRLANDTIAIANIMIEYRKEANKFDPIAKSLQSSAKKLSQSNVGLFAEAFAEGAKEGYNNAKSGKTGTKVDVETAGKALTDRQSARNATARLASKAVELLQGLPAKYYGYATSTCRAYLDWAQLSLKEYKAAEAK